MVARFRTWLSAPTLPDEEQTRLARLLHIMLFTCLGATMLVGLTSVVFELWLTAQTMVLGFACIMGFFVLNQRGHVHRASILFLLVLLLVVTFLLFVGQGIHDIAAIVYPTIIIAGSLLLRRWLFVIFCGLTLGSVLLVVTAELSGWIATDFTGVTGPADFIFAGTIVGVTAVCMWMLAGELKQSIGLLRHKEAALREQTQLLRTSEAQWRSLIEQAPDPVMHVDAHGTIRFHNSPDNFPQPSGASLFDFVIPSDRLRLKKALASVFDEGMPHNLQVMVNYDAESTAWREFRLSPIFHDDDVTGVTVIATNIDAQKTAELERERLIGELEAKNDELERFTYTVSHDLKSPLVTIKGFTGLIQRSLREQSFDRAEEDLERIGRAADEMNHLLTDLLELSRVGRMVNPPERIELASLLDDALERVRGQLDAAEVAVQVAEPLPALHGDRPRLVAVFQNLLDNAIKFMGDEPQPRIEIEAVRKGAVVTCSISDNGIGILPAYHDRVFQIFERLHPEFPGSGIGMALVQRIIELHGGSIWIESEGNGTGTTVRFTLPAA